MMAIISPSPSLPLYLFLISVTVYCFGRLAFAWIFSGTKRSSSQAHVLSNLAATEKSPEQAGLMRDEGFELEKRAFFSKTWLFVCHQSKFSKPGDYHTFAFAGIHFFIVLGQDLKLRAFHNVCRHRAYTVVRKSCGSTKLFSCKYHGWQYDDQGSLVKAPKFDLSPGFRPEENGLFQVKLLRTQEGLVRVNFDSTTLAHPLRDMTSNLGMGDSTWVDGFDKDTQINWKVVAQDFASQAQWSSSSKSWLPKLCNPKSVQMLGPLAMLREMGQDVWCTLKVLPENSTSTKIRCDFYARAGYAVKLGMSDRYKLIIEKEILGFQMSQSEKTVFSPFSYEVGGRSVDLAAILSQHQRSEIVAKKKLQPRIRLGEDADDIEAETLCNILDNRQVGGTPKERMQPTIEW